MTQERQIFTIRAEIVDSNGTWAPLTLNNVTYPANFDSKNSPYNGNIQMALERATAAFCDIKSSYLKRDDRQLQKVILETSDGRQIDRYCKGALAPVVVPDPEPNEPEEEP